MEEIVNRVAKSSLLTLDLESLFPTNKSIFLDIKQWLEEGFILKEKEFRSALKEHDWDKYQGKYVALYCSADAILPAWTNLLITSYLTPWAEKVVCTDNEEELDNAIFMDLIKKMSINEYKDKPVIVKGCSQRTISENVFIALIEKLQPVVKSLFYGEACSSVPLYKRKN